MRIRDDQGWHGDLSNTWNYESLPKMIRSTLRERFPDCKWSVRRMPGGMTPVLSVRLMEAPELPVAEWGPHMEGYRQIHGDDSDLKPWARDMFRFVNDYLESLNYNHSDVMVDYFDVAFYANVYIGDYDKPFRIREKAGKRK